MDKIKSLYTFLIALLVPFILVPTVCSFFDFTDYSYLRELPDKAILFIGDGMGENHIAITEQKLNKDLFFTNFDKQGYVETNSLTVGSPTDSAASATALATGKKVFNGEVAYNFGSNIESISEILKRKGYGVGIVTSDYLSGATPSGFSSHASNRNNEEEIINNQIISNIDLFLGRATDAYINRKEEIKENGYTYIEKVDELIVQDGKVFGAFDKINNYESKENRPTLPMLMDYAVDYFEKNYPNGYFIMCEQAYIDKRSHDNDVSEMIEYLDELNNTVELTYNKLKDENTFIMVTADHETGGLKLPNDNEEITDELYTTTSHTSKNVKYFINHQDEKIYNIGDVIDNTHVFRICSSIFN